MTIRLLIILSSLPYFLNAGCASAPAEHPSAKVVSEAATSATDARSPVEVFTETIAIYVDYNEKMFANLDSIREMTRLLKTSLEERLDRYEYRARFLATPEEFEPGPHQFILKVRLDDYHSGPQKSVFVHYDFTGPNLPVLTNDIKLSTMKGSSKLMRVIASQLTEIIDARLKAGR